MASVAEIKAQLAAAREDQLEALMRCYENDERCGVQAALASAQKRLERQRAERERLRGMYAFEEELAASHGGGVIVGIDEVGRGPLAGPLAAGAVVLNRGSVIAGLDDSKKLTPAQREATAALIRKECRACAISYVSPQQIDEQGIAASLRQAFADALSQVESQGILVDVVLLDGNPVGFDPREVSVVKGDGRCVSIAAASIVAKVARDHLMEELDERYPGYGFASHKGYGSDAHIGAIRKLGLSTVHRASFCTKILHDASS